MKRLKYTTSFEGELVKYYEMFFYRDGKDEIVDKAVEYVNRYISKHMGPTRSYGTILDVGCGTGVYDGRLKALFDTVEAIDMSSDMIEYANLNNQHEGVHYTVHNICDRPYATQADVCVSLSHVIGYQYTNDQVRAFIQNISRSLLPGGLFVFNFYNEPAILCGELSDRVSECTEQGIYIRRESSAVPILEENVLQNSYKYYIKDDNDYEISIVEKMRYFTVFELEEYLYVNDMEIVDVKDYLTDADLSGSCWNGCIIAKKKQSRSS